MNKNIKSALRNLVKRRLFSIVNITSLTFGLLCALFIGTYLIYEFSFDRQIKEHESVFRVTSVRDNNEQGVIVPTAIKPYLDTQVDQVAQAARAQRTGPLVFRVDEELIRERNGYYADPELLDILSIAIHKGEGEQALKTNGTILISEELSQKYFPNESAVGQEIKIDTWFEEEPVRLVVRGVFNTVKPNNHFRPDYLISIDVLKKGSRKPLSQEWSNSNCFTYVRLINDVSAGLIDERIADIVVENSDFDMSGYKLQLQPVTNIHMQDFTAFGDIPGQVSKSNMYILSGIGLLIILLVCINFFNMSTARSLERAKEIGIRKTIGASRKSLMIQFMTESAMQVSIGLILSVILVEVFDESITSMTGLSFNLNAMIGAFGYYNFCSFVVLLWFFLVIGSGFYPALIISKFKPVDSLKGRINVGTSKVGLSKVLLVLQFTITLSIGIIALVVYNQVSFMQVKDPGFQRDTMVSVDLATPEIRKAFVNELEKEPLVESVAFTDSNVINIFNSSTGYYWPGLPEDETVRMFHMSIDDQFIPSMGITLLAGRNLNDELTTDDNSVILNESAAKIMGIQDFDNLPSITNGKDKYERKLNVIGVIKDFQSGTLRDKDKPIIFYRNKRRLFRACIKLSGNNTAQAITSINQIWDSIIKDEPFEYASMNDDYERILAKDKASGNTLLFFTVVSVAISFFGLFGMTSLSIQSRVKELGIRKILGAHFKDIFGAISKQFKYTMLLALLIGVPLAWFLGDQWLNEFTHRIDLTTLIPLQVVIGMSLLGLITIYFCMLKFTRKNPVETLREN
ncbi:FtsX-like permease family protein [Roseivirga sp.]|uniref:ABC transporter permease n=1 Tax=Roseivirga sp. TaxID=1964215 RepID=UPI003B8C8A2A